MSRHQTRSAHDAVISMKGACSIAALSVSSLAYGGTGANAELTDPTPSGASSEYTQSAHSLGMTNDRRDTVTPLVSVSAANDDCDEGSGGCNRIALQSRFETGNPVQPMFNFELFEQVFGDCSRVVADIDIGGNLLFVGEGCSCRRGGGGSGITDSGTDLENPIRPGQTVLPYYGDKLESAPDLHVLLSGIDFTFTRQYVSDLDFVGPDLLGANWQSDHFGFIQTNGNDLEIIGQDFETLEFSDQSGTGAGPWDGLDPWGETITATTLAVGGSTYGVHLVDHPGRGTRAYYRSHAGGGGVTATDPALEGLLLYEEDLYGNHRHYEYTIYGTALSDPSKEHARIDTITCYRNETTPAREATIEFTWQDDDAQPNKGKLLSISVKRPTSGADLETQRVEYTYKESGDGNSDATGTEGDLIQVLHAARLDNSTSTLSTWRRTVTQYRYHGGETNETTVDLDGDGFIEQGSAHQLKAVLNPEQVEFFAQQLVDNDAAFSTFDSAIDELLTRDDDEVWYTGSSEETSDVFAKLITKYETSGQERVLEQWLLSSCGCGGSGSALGTRLNYDYFAYGSGSAIATLKLDEYVDDGTGTMTLHTTRYYDTVDGDSGGAVRPLTSNVAIVDGSDEWVTHRKFDAKRRVTHIARPSAVSSYTPGTSSTAPSLTLSTTDGFVSAYEYEGDTHYRTNTYIREGYNATIGNYFKLSSKDRNSTRPWLIDSHENYTVETTGTPTADQTSEITLTYGFHSGTDAVAWVKISAEQEKEGENGPPGSKKAETYHLFDEAGLSKWARGADASLTAFDFDSVTGVVDRIEVNASNTIGGSWAGLSTTGWGLTGDQLLREAEVDELGRFTKITTTSSATGFAKEEWTVREMRSLADRPGIDYYAVVTLPHVVEHGGSERFAEAASVVWRNADSDLVRISEYVPDVDGSGDYDLVTLSNSLGTELSRAVVEHTASGLAEKRRSWHDVSSDKYAEVVFDYDEQGRVETATDPDGTISRFTYDVFGRTIKTEIGTVASGGSANMVTVTEVFYDSGGTATQGVGDGRVTLVRQHVDGSTTRDTEHEYDYRGRRIKTLNPTTPHTLNEYDNLDRITRTADVTSANPTTIDGEAANRISLTETSYSQRGMRYKTRTAIDPTQTGGNLEWQETHSWFDENGREIASWSGGLASKTKYDTLGRVEKVYLTDRRDDAAPGGTDNHVDASDVKGDVVLQEVEYSYITDTHLIDLVTTRLRAHDALVTDTDALSNLASAKKITTYTANYYDNAGRPIHSVLYGTNTTGFKHGGSAPTVTQASPPTRTASGLLMSSTVYDDHDGDVIETIAPDGVVTRTFRDDLGRTIGVAENYVNADITGWDATNKRWTVSGVGGTGVDVDRLTTFTYTEAGLQRKRVAHPTTGTLQETEYVYEPNTSSDVQSYGLLKEVRYPDTTNSGDAGTTNVFKIRYTHNRLGQTTEMTDQNGTTHEYTYDGGGRLTKDEVTSFGTDVDQWIDRIESSYDSAGRREFVRSKDGSTVKNAVKFVYDAQGRLEDVVQDVDGDIGGGDDLTVSYAFDDEPIGSGNRSRLDTLTYPDGSVFATSYGSAGSVNDEINRLEAIELPGGATNAVEYEYVGVGTLATTTYTDAGFILDRTLKANGARTAGEYPGYDQFGRIERHVWADDTITTHATDTTVPNIPPVIEQELAYNKSSNRTRTIDARPGAQREMRDVVYDYDDLGRLIEAERGEWGGSSLSNVKGSQEWTLDALGNWDTLKHDKNADGDYGEAFEREDRTYNEANKYTDADYPQDTGPLIFDNDFDDSGNMSKIETEVSTALATHHLTFDAWNRLVEVEVNATPQDLSRYAYNGLNWRTEAEIDTDNDGTHDQKRQMYYDASWRLLEERIDNDYNGIDKYAQQLWGGQYIDDSIFRREGTWNVSTVAWISPTYDLSGPLFSVEARVSGKTGALKERVRYRAYGEARHQWGHDVDGDGAADSTDSGIISTAAGLSAVIGDSNYDVDADLDRDGDIDSADSTAWSARGTQSALTLGDISGSGAIVGWSGYMALTEYNNYLVRMRAYETTVGAWLQNDPAGYVSGSSLTEYAMSSPINMTDASGLDPCGTCPSTSPGSGLFCRDLYRRLEADDNRVRNQCIVNYTNVGIGIVDVACVVACTIGTGPFAPACLAGCGGITAALAARIHSCLTANYFPRRDASRTTYCECLRYQTRNCPGLLEPNPFGFNCHSVPHAPTSGPTY